MDALCRNREPLREDLAEEINAAPSGNLIYKPGRYATGIDLALTVERVAVRPSSSCKVAGEVAPLTQPKCARMCEAESAFEKQLCAALRVFGSAAELRRKSLGGRLKL